MNYLYLWIDLFSFLGPFLLSFDKKVAFYKKWKALLPSIVIMMLLFIPWDVYFTVNGIWGFNEKYLCGLEILHLPIEEWLFFIVVPYACVFIYECLRVYSKDFLRHVAKPILLMLSIALVIVGMYKINNAYTAVNFLGAGVMILISFFTLKDKLGYSLFAYLVGLIPFLLVNGVLTGSMLDEPIVWYNDEENLGIRIFTIPVEDTFYFLFFFLLVLVLYEKFKAYFLIQGNS
ncbi:MAG: lycopene cyclase domain-containing protein [Flavobacteriales bacterium]|nr:lycopene cyclase domain-containing protein [Flavobacteriales bacterium]